jgi:transcriptional regulator with XRE-family HTH domain
MLMPVRLRIREVAEEKGINLSQLARRADLGMTTARRMWFGTGDGREDGSSLQYVSLDSLERIAHALGVSPRELLAQDE